MELITPELRPYSSCSDRKDTLHFCQSWWHAFSSSKRFAKLSFLLTLFVIILIVIILIFTLSPLIGNHLLSKPRTAVSSSFWLGVNDWGIAGSKGNYDCGARDIPHIQLVDNTFSHLKAAGASVVRFWAFQTYAQSLAVNGHVQRDWSALDEVFESAKAHGIRLVPVLDNEWNDCDYWPLSLDNYHYAWPLKYYSGWFQPTKTFAIKSSTNTTPIVIETQTPLGFPIGHGGIQVTISGHDQANANGVQWDTYILDATHIELYRKWPQNTPSVGGPHPGGPTGTLTTITYQTPKDGTLTSYSQWVQDIAARYGPRYGGNSPDRTILAWELVNEPREDPTVLSHFFKDTISVMKAKDPLTPISLGAIDNGEQGFRGADFKMQNAIDGVGYVTAHDYFNIDDPLPISPSCQANCIRSAIRDAASLGKPFFVGEMGSEMPDSQMKADKYRAKILAACRAGAIGYLLWNYVDDISPGGDGYDFGAHSPILAMFSQFEQHDAAVCGPSKNTSRLSYHSPYVGWEANLLSEEVPPRTATPK